MNNSMLPVLIFALSYVFFILFPAKRMFFAVGASLLIVLTGILTWQEALAAVNWNVMGIFVGMLFVADIFLAALLRRMNDKAARLYRRVDR